MIIPLKLLIRRTVFSVAVNIMYSVFSVAVSIMYSVFSVAVSIMYSVFSVAVLCILRAISVMKTTILRLWNTCVYLTIPSRTFSKICSVLWNFLLIPLQWRSFFFVRKIIFQVGFR